MNTIGKIKISKKQALKVQDIINMLFIEYSSEFVEILSSYFKDRITGLAFRVDPEDGHYDDMFWQEIDYIFNKFIDKHIAKGEISHARSYTNHLIDHLHTANWSLDVKKIYIIDSADYKVPEQLSEKDKSFLQKYFEPSNFKHNQYGLNYNIYAIGVTGNSRRSRLVIYLDSIFQDKIVITNEVYK
jgi:hypothetical protein